MNLCSVYVDEDLFIFLISIELTTIFNLLGRPGASTYGQAMALCVVLAGITAISISLLDRTGAVIRDNA